MGYIQISHLYLGSKAIREKKKLFNSLSTQTSEREEMFPVQIFRYFIKQRECLGLAGI